MIRSLRFSRAADCELLDAQEWYERQRAGLGAEFRAAVERSVQRIRQNALQFPVLHKQYRRALVDRFPYALIFGIGSDESVGVFACVHTSRESNVWVQRL